jgi:hypothetical protein
MIDFYEIILKIKTLNNCINKILRIKSMKRFEDSINAFSQDVININIFFHYSKESNYSPIRKEINAYCNSPNNNL